MQCKCLAPNVFTIFSRPPEWGQIEGVVHTGRHYTNFVWSMNFTVCLFVSLPLQVWLFHLPFFSPVFWVLDTYKVWYSQLLTQALLDFITEILCQTKEDCVYHCWRPMTHPSSTQCNYFSFSSNPFFRAFKWIILGLPVSIGPCLGLSIKSAVSINLGFTFDPRSAFKTNSKMVFWAILKLRNN